MFLFSYDFEKDKRIVYISLEEYVLLLSAVGPFSNIELLENIGFGELIKMKQAGLSVGCIGLPKLRMKVFTYIHLIK